MVYDSSQSDESKVSDFFCLMDKCYKGKPWWQKDKNLSIMRPCCEPPPGSQVRHFSFRSQSGGTSIILRDHEACLQVYVGFQNIHIL
ncbi:hypothetical protein M413DRAFT_354960 [Hebeloma cylindrosporum]|uniref:Uncharacterized protein n=1 Tax=Hebeloma cylindrosporum TaxID=76867 RepID=A0A0C3CK63_HEBCY|nr:hypothetical protein M413DRAFT_354960 [Hebeloma cylindrosporum h7]